MGRWVPADWRAARTFLADLCRPPGLNWLRGSCRWLTPPAMILSASGLSSTRLFSQVSSSPISYPYERNAARIRHASDLVGGEEDASVAHER